jgi:diguanylate cyclase
VQRNTGKWYATGFEPRGGELLRLALPAMAKRQIPMTPPNYAVWYDYLDGTNAGLKQEIGRLLSNGGEFSPTAITELYRDHVATFENPMAEQARELLAGASTSFSDATDEFRVIEDALKLVAERIERKPGEGDLRATLEELINHSSDIKAQGENLSKTLAERQQELETLREELAQARKQASTDTLTGLASRGSFDERLTELTFTHNSEGEGFGRVMLDIDHFKVVNDTHGHLVGDKVLRYAAKTIRNSLRAQDLGARFGGEEFAVLLPQSDLQNCRVLAESIRTAMENSRLVKSGSDESLSDITLSCGIAIHRPGEPSIELVDRADNALYASKRQGRNRTTDETATEPTNIAHSA